MNANLICLALFISITMCFAHNRGYDHLNALSSDDNWSDSSSYGGTKSYGSQRGNRGPAFAVKGGRKAYNQGGFASGNRQSGSGNYGGSGGSYGSSGSYGSGGSSYGSSGSSYGGSSGHMQPMPYNFNYDFNDDFGGNQARNEVADSNGNVKGSYSYRDANGIYRKVEYTAGKEGFKAIVHSNEPGLGTTDNPADVIYNVEDPPAGAYNSKSSYRSNSGGSYSRSYNKPSKTSSYGGSQTSSYSGAGSQSYGGGRSQSYGGGGSQSYGSGGSRSSGGAGNYGSMGGSSGGGYSKTFRKSSHRTSGGGQGQLKTDYSNLIHHIANKVGHQRYNNNYGY